MFEQYESAENTTNGFSIVTGETETIEQTSNEKGLMEDARLCRKKMLRNRIRKYFGGRITGVYFPRARHGAC